MLRDEDYDELLQRFPSVRFAFAYGSGAIEQAGYSQKYASVSDGPMLDMIFAVDDPAAWHLENKRQNPSHYTSLITELIAHFQENYGASVWFNAMVPMGITAAPQRLMKYGVISTAALVEDLSEWKSLYIAGRLHKPVKLLRSPGSETMTAGPDLRSLVRHNRRFALATALLLQEPEVEVCEERLHATIAGLSYTGDPRMGIAENPEKIANLVNPLGAAYRALYRPHLQALEESGVLELPKLSSSSETSIKTLLQTPHGLTPATVSTSVARIVRRSATTQSIKGLVTIGFFKSAVYSLQKVKKRFGI
eukprot:GSChrysophyteH1.ASY1.ANO1.3271.1 assembled CDS